MVAQIHWAIRVYRASLKDYSKAITSFQVFRRTQGKEKVYYVI